MMKPLLTTIVATAALADIAVAGETTYGKSYKQPAPPAPSGCFSDQELQIDTFGQASFGDGSKAGLFRDSAYGGGIGLNYFFHRNIGLGIDAAWLSAKESTIGGNRDNDRTTLHNVTGSLIFRAPIEGSACFAPYAYLGGGFHADGYNWASAHVGVGIEYRIVPQKVGIFLDGRWTYLGDKAGVDDLNFFGVRAGLRLVF